MTRPVRARPTAGGEDRHGHAQRRLAHGQWRAGRSGHDGRLANRDPERSVCFTPAATSIRTSTTCRTAPLHLPGARRRRHGGGPGARRRHRSDPQHDDAGHHAGQRSADDRDQGDLDRRGSGGRLHVDSGDFAFNDPSDTIPPSSVQPHQLDAIIVNAPTSGTLKVGATTVSGTTTVSLAQLQGNQLVYTPAPNFNGSATLNFQVQDNGGTNFGGQDTSLAGTSIAFTVNSVNDAPLAQQHGQHLGQHPRKTRSIRSRSPTSASPTRMTRPRTTSSTCGSSPARPMGRC